MKIRPISLSAAGTDEKGRYVYKVAFETDSNDVREHSFTIDTSTMSLLESESEFYIATYDDRDFADALILAVRKFHDARHCP